MSLLSGNMTWDRVEGVMNNTGTIWAKGGLLSKIYQKLQMSKGRGDGEMRQREKISEGGGRDEEPERSCRCSRRPTAAERRSCHFVCVPPQHQHSWFKWGVHPTSVWQHVCWDAACHTVFSVLLIFDLDHRGHQIIKTGWMGCTQDFAYRSGRMYARSQRGPHMTQNPIVLLQKK